MKNNINKYNWESNKDIYDLNKFKKAIRKEIKKALKPIKDYIKESTHEGNSKIK